MSAVLASLVVPGSHRVATHTVQVWNVLPHVLVVVLMVAAILSVVVVMAQATKPIYSKTFSIWVVAIAAVLVAAGLLACSWLIPYVLLTPTHAEMKRQDQVAVQAGGKTIVWTPAHRLPSGVWWPDDTGR